MMAPDGPLPQQDNSLFPHFIGARNVEADTETLAARYSPAELNRVGFLRKAALPLAVA
jgi:hypothetical protein